MLLLWSLLLACAAFFGFISSPDSPPAPSGAAAMARLAPDSTLDQARNNYQSAVAKLNQLRNPDPREVLQARSSVANAESSLRSAEAKLAGRQ